MEAVLREGRQQVEEGLVEDQITVSAELDAMKALYNRVWKPGSSVIQNGGQIIIYIYVGDVAWWAGGRRPGDVGESFAVELST